MTLNKENAQFWKSFGETIQYRHPGITFWKVLKDNSKPKDNWEFRILPSEVGGFHVDVRCWWDGYNNYVVARAYWRGKQILKSQYETGSQSYGEQRAREMLRERGLVFSYLSDIASTSYVTLKKKSEL